MVSGILWGFSAPTHSFAFFFGLTRGFLMYYSGTASSPCCSVNPWATSTVEPPWSPTSPTPRPTTWRHWPQCSWPPASIAWGRRSPGYLSFYLGLLSVRGWKRPNTGLPVFISWNKSVWFICQVILIWTLLLFMWTFSSLKVPMYFCDN